MTRKEKIEKYVQDFPSGNFYDICVEMARDNISRTLEIPGVLELVYEEYNNDVIEFIEAAAEQEIGPELEEEE